MFALSDGLHVADAHATAGGESALLTNLGKDATAQFRQAHGESAHDMLASLYIGDLGEESSHSAPRKGPGSPVRSSPVTGLASSAQKSGVTLTLPKSIDKPGDSLSRWPALGDLAKLQGLKSAPWLGGAKDVVAPTDGGIALTSALTYAASADTSPVAAVAPGLSRKADPGADAAGRAVSAPVPPPGHGEGGDISACPFMALANLAEQNAKTGQDAPLNNGSPVAAVGRGSPPRAVAGKFGDVAGLMGPIHGASHIERTFMQESMHQRPAPGSFRQGSVAGSNAERSSAIDRLREGSVVSSRKSGSRRSAGQASSQYASQMSGSKGGKPSSAIGSGGVFRDHRKKRRGGQKKATIDKTPQVDMSRWPRSSKLIRDSWEVIMKRASFMEIGAAIYDRITSVNQLETLFSYTDRALQGRKFVDMLNSIMIALDSPSEVYSKMMELAPLHHRRGVRGTHMPVMGPLLINVFASLGGEGFTPEMRTAWEYFWEFTSRCMVQSLSEVGSTLNIVQNSWDDMTERYTNEELGRKMFEELYRTAPSLSSRFFSNDKAIDMASKMGDMLGMLVSYADDPAALKQQVTWLGRRHVIYGVRPQMIPLMGPVIMAALQTAADENWGMEEEKAWNVVLTIVIDSMAEAIAEGEEYGHTLQALWTKVQSASSPEDFGAHLYPHFTKSCVCTFLQGFCDRSHEAEPSFFSEEVQKLDEFDLDISVSGNSHSGSGSGSGSGGVDAEGETMEEDEDVEEQKDKAGWALPFFGRRSSGTSDKEVQGASLNSISVRRTPEKPKKGILSMFSGSNIECKVPVGMTGKGNGVSHLLNSTTPENGKRRQSVVTLETPNKSMKGKDADHHHHAASRTPGKTPEKNTTGSTSGWKPTPSDQELILGQQTWNMLDTLISLVWEPETQQEKVYVTASQFFRRGMRSGHIRMLGDALRGAVAEAVGDEDFDEKSRNAWEWFWRDLSSWLVRELDSLSAGVPDLVLSNWKRVNATVEVENLGEIFWTQVTYEAPEQTNLYRLPLRMWGFLFKHIVNMLVLSARQPERFYGELFDLVIRHIRYGVRAEFLNPMGKAIMSVLQETLGDTYDDTAADAWKTVFKRVANSMARGLNLGANSITHGLVSGNVDAFEKAVSVAPRENRAEWLCKVNVNGLAISPLYWAIDDGKLTIAEYILGDLLTIRVDMKRYYYGREELFSYHKDLMQELASKCPKLVPVLLDGLMWHSKEKSGRKVRVNYYIADLYGDPSKNSDVWTSPLAVLARVCDNETFTHPASRKVLELKWTRFGLKVFLVNEAIFAAILVLFLLEHVFNVENAGCSTSVLGVGSTSTVEVALTVISGIMVAFHLGVCITQVFQGKVIAPDWAHSDKLRVPRHLLSVWNVMRIFSVVLIFTVYFVEDDCNTSSRRSLVLDDGTVVVSAPLAIKAVVMVLMWIQMVQLTLLSTRMSAFTYAIGVMLRDLFHSFAMIAVLLLAAASALAILREPPYDRFVTAVVMLINDSLNIEEPDIDGKSWLSLAFITMFAIGFISMISIMIASLSSTYEKIKDEKDAYALKSRAEVCLEIEDLLPLRLRQRIYDDLGFAEQLPFGKDDLGPPGGIQYWELDSCDRYNPDRIMRFTGSGGEKDPWPEWIENA